MNQAVFIKRSANVAWRRLGKELMIMSARDSSLFTLNETAAVLWEAADGTNSLEEIVTKTICAQFQVDLRVALEDAEELARELAAHGILSVAGKPENPGIAMQAGA